MAKYDDLILRLNSVKSRSKSKLLQEAATAIELLQNDLLDAVSRLRERTLDCLQCDHNNTTPCASVPGSVVCDEHCPLDCPCKDCGEFTHWMWRGICPADK